MQVTFALLHSCTLALPCLLPRVSERSDNKGHSDDGTQGHRRGRVGRDVLPGAEA